MGKICCVSGLLIVFMWMYVIGTDVEVAPKILNPFKWSLCIKVLIIVHHKNIIRYKIFKFSDGRSFSMIFELIY